MERLRAIGQVFVMAAIAATLVALPGVALLFALSALFFGLPLHSFVTFGGAVSEPLGLAGWWLVMLVPASIYALLVSHAMSAG